MTPHSSSDPSEFSTAIRRSTRSSRVSTVLVLRLTARMLRSVVSLPTINGSRSESWTKLPTSNAFVTTMSAWPLPNAANWSKELVTSALMSWSCDHRDSPPEPSIHSQIGLGARSILTVADAAGPAAAPPVAAPLSPPQAASAAAVASTARTLRAVVGALA